MAARTPGRLGRRPAVGAVTIGLRGERLAELGAMADSLAGVRVFSDDGRCVADAVLMRRVLEYVKAFDGVVAQHAQEPRLTEGAQMHEGEVSAVLGLAGWPRSRRRPIIARDVLLAEHVGSRLHVCHVSTAGSVDIIRWAKKRGVNVTAEVTPHHLMLTHEWCAATTPYSRSTRRCDGGGRPGAARRARRRHDRHRRDRPRTAPARSQGVRVGGRGQGHGRARDRAAGRPAAMVDTGLIEWAGVARRMSTVPAAIGGLTGQGTGQGGALEAGAPAHLVLVDPAARAVVDPGRMATAGRNNPFRGRELPGRVVATFYRGTPTVLGGALAEPAADLEEVRA